jgi:membrane associated rhomboid family serine protease
MFSITLSIIILTCLISVTAFNNDKIKNDLLFWPAEIDDRRQFYRFLTYGLVHGDIMHLAFNMISIYSFGEYVEKYLFSHPTLFGASGKIIYLILYVSAIIVSAIPDYVMYRNTYAYRALGASGAVCAVIFAGIVLSPTLPINLFFIPIDIPGYIFGAIFLAISVWLGKRGGDNIGHRAHFTGAIYGILFTIIVGRAVAHYDVVKAFFNAILNR